MAEAKPNFKCKKKKKKCTCTTLHVSDLYPPDNSIHRITCKKWKSSHFIFLMHVKELTGLLYKVVKHWALIRPLTSTKGFQMFANERFKSLQVSLSVTHEKFNVQHFLPKMLSHFWGQRLCMYTRHLKWFFPVFLASENWRVDKTKKRSHGQNVY